MPSYTETEKRNILVNAGLDPSKYFFDEVSSQALPVGSPVQQTQPTQPSVSTAPKVDSTFGEAFSLGFKKEIFPSSTGLMTGLTGAAIGAPFAPPFGSIAGLLIGGFGGSLGAQALQQKAIIPPDVQARMATVEKERPFSTFGGELAANLITANPIRSLQSVGRLATRFPQAIRPTLQAGLSDAEKNILYNMALNSAIAGGSEGYSQFREGEFDPVKLGARVLGYGLLGNEPNLLGRKIGIPGTADFPSARPGVELPTERVPEIGVESTLGPIDYVKTLNEQLRMDVPVKSAERSAQAMLSAQRAQRAKEFELAKEEVRIKDMELAVKERELMERQLNLNQIQESTIPRINPQKTSMKGMERAATEAETRPLSSAEQEELRIERELYGRRFQEEESTTLERVPEWLQREQDEAAKKRGFNIQTTEKPLGGSGAGSYTPSQRLIQRSPTKAGLDTTPHEGKHGLIADLLNSKDPKDRALGKRAIEMFRNRGLTDAEQKIADRMKARGATEDIIAEEFLVKKLGRTDVQRSVEGDKTFKAWWEDVKSSYKVRFGLGNEDDVIRHINARYRYDAPYGTRSEFLADAGKYVKPVAQEDEPTEKPWNHWFYKEGAKDIPDNWQITVQEPISEGGKVIMPGYVQIDKVDPVTGKDYESTSIEALRKEGYDVPDYDKILVQGKYKAGEINDKIRKTFWQEDEPMKMEEGYPKSIFDTKAGKQAKSYMDNLVSEGILKKEEADKLALEERGKEIGKEIKGRLEEASFQSAKQTEKAQKDVRRTGDTFLSDYTHYIYNKAVEKWEEPPAPYNQGWDTIKVLARDFISGEPSSRKQLENDFGSEWVDELDNSIRIYSERIKDLDRDRIDRFQESFKKSNFKAEEAEAFTRPDVERHQEMEPDYSLTSHGMIPAWRSAIDKVRTINNKEGPLVAEAVNTFTVRRDNYNGRAVNIPLENVSGLRLSPDERKNVFNHLRAKDWGKPLPRLTPKEQQAATLVEQSWNDVNNLITQTKADIRYKHDILKDEANEFFRTKQGTPEYRKALDDWADYVQREVGGDRDKIRNTLSDYVTTFGGGKLFAKQYKALKEAIAYPIPDNLRETDLYKVIHKYGRRVAQDVAYWKELQSKPDVASALGLPDSTGGLIKTPGIDDIGNNPEVQKMMQFVFQDFPNVKKHPRINAAARIFVNQKMGAATGIRDIGQVPVFSLPYVQTFGDVLAFGKAFTKLREARIDSLKAGVRGLTMDLDRWHMLESPDAMTGWFNKIAGLMRLFQGREHLEQFARIYTFGLGKEMAKPKVLQAIKGDKDSLSWLKKFGTGIENWNLKEWGPDELNQVAANFTTRVQGSYDARGLPAGAFDSPFAPMFSLARWSVEKSNVIYKDVFLPMKKGNFKPFLMYSLGSVLTGTAIKELNEFLSGGKKAANVSVKEAVDQDRKDYLFSSFVNLLQMAGYAGIMSDLLKTATDPIIEKEAPRGPITFPMADFLTEDLAAATLGAKQAIDDGANPEDVAIGLAWEVIAKQVQNLRLADMWLDNDQVKRKNKYRDMRVFNKLSGENVPSMLIPAAKEIVETPEKKFKRTSDLGEAIEELPEMLKGVLERSEGDPYRLKSELRGLKSNSYQTMPDPNTQPIKFFKYFQFLERTQGADEAIKRMQDWILQRELNKAKSEMVPDL